jgi:hypothetical protein
MRKNQYVVRGLTEIPTSARNGSAGLMESQAKYHEKPLFIPNCAQFSAGDIWEFDKMLEEDRLFYFMPEEFTVSVELLDDSDLEADKNRVLEVIKTWAEKCRVKRSYGWRLSGLGHVRIDRAKWPKDSVRVVQSVLLWDTVNLCRSKRVSVTQCNDEHRKSELRSLAVGLETYGPISVNSVSIMLAGMRETRVSMRLADLEF